MKFDLLLMNSKLNNSYSVCTCRGVNLGRFVKKRSYYYVLIIFSFLSHYFRGTYRLKSAEIVSLYNCRQLSIFPNNSL